jgi:hypothetical protein
MSVTNKALVSVMPGAQPIRIRAKLREHRIQFARNRRAVDHIRAFVASGFQLAGAKNSFFEGCSFVIVDGRTSRWVGTE